MLCVVGDLVEDVIVRPTAPIRADTDNPAEIERRRGGSAANTAAAAAVAGGSVRFVGAVGDDDTGRRLVAELRDLGVDVAVDVVAERTGTVVVVVEPGGVRTMYPDRGAATRLAPGRPDRAEGVGWLHAPLYGMTTAPMAAAITELAERVRAAGGRVSVDLSSVALLSEVGPAVVAGWLGQLGVDTVFGTAAEVDGLRCDPGVLVVVKDGPRPVVVRRAGATIARVAVAPVASVVDPTGAGDAFAAGVALAALGRADLEQALRAGIALAARAITVIGATPGLPSP